MKLDETLEQSMSTEQSLADKLLFSWDTLQILWVYCTVLDLATGTVILETSSLDGKMEDLAQRVFLPNKHSNTMTLK